MRKTTIIATCLVNSNMFRLISDAEFAVKKIFFEDFQESTFEEWNSCIDDRVAENIINAVGRASMINVHRFIDDLSEDRRIYKSPSVLENLKTACRR